MSWHVTAVGRAAAVAEKIAADLAKIKCAEPEETIKNQIGTVIQSALAAMPAASAVKVTASGSQSTSPYGSSTPDGYFNSASLQIEPQYGFVE